MFETGKCAQVTREMRRYGISILGVSEMRWSSCGKLMTATGEAVLYLAMDEEETRRMHSQEGDRVEPTGEAQERQTPAHLEAHKNGRVGEETAPVAGSEAHCSK